MQATATRTGQWLQRLAGEWAWEMEAEGQPGEPPIRESGTESVRSLGPWAICESTGRTPDGGEATSIMSIGYDPERGRFIGTFLSSMMAYLWLYDGELDADGRVLTLAAEGPSYTGEPGTASYRDTIELVSDDHRVHTSAYQAADGSWHQFMTVHYRRTR
jgi:Protein of unknown function (DUF1579)